MSIKTGASVIAIGIGLSLGFIKEIFAQDGVMINYGPGTREQSAILDLKSTNQGFLAPKVNIADLGTAAPVTSPAEGLIVYNENNGTGEGYYYWTGTEWTRLLNGSSAPPTGSGTLNYISKWTPDGTTLGNSLLFDNGTNLGLGTNAPVESFEIKKTGSNPVQLFHSGGVASYKLGNDGNVFKIAAMDNGYGGHAGDFAANDVQVISMTTSGNVGIGTTTPNYKLEVNGTGKFNNTLTTATPTNNSAVSDLGYDAPIAIPQVNTGSGGFVPIVQATTLISSGYRKHVNIGSYRTGSGWGGGIYLAQGGNDSYPTEYFLLGHGGIFDHSSGDIATNGNLAIGTTGPTQRLDVNGKIRMRTGAATGYIPVSSADGTMTWTDPSAYTSDDQTLSIGSTEYNLSISGGNTVELTHLRVADTRNDNEGPDAFNNEVAFDFKLRSSVDNVPGAGAYSGMMTIAPWGDNSGDASHQINFNEGGLFWRQGQPQSSTWGA